MKKILSLVIVFTLLFSTCFVISVGAATPALHVGDMNNDGTVDIIDATLIQRSLLGLYETYLMNIKGDFDHDGEVSVVDATLIQRKDVNIDIPSTCGGIIFTDIYIDAFEPNIASGEATVGTQIEFTAQAVSPQGDITYEFYVEGVLVQPRSENNVLNYTFEKSGNYMIEVIAYNYGGIPRDDFIEDYRVIE